ncbi:hypothetical protein HJFPF1_02024 [Paramyrothecium foliicola]|nr:hypothetical protein HJFPF1_02024 [Paramyrothecium foliicola]
MNPSNKRVGDALLGVAIAGGITLVPLAILPLIAGTFLVGDQLALREFAYASFDGIVPNNDSTALLVRMYWFPSTFAWEYPDAPEGVPKAGFTYKGPIWRLDTVEQFRTIAKDLGLPRDDWYCPSVSSNAPECANPFFEGWRSWLADPFGGAPGLYFIILILAIVLTVTQLAQEWAMKKKPYWMKCRCAFAKSLCPCPKGTREEIESADEHVWDKVRLAYWGLVVAYFVLPAVHATVMSTFFVMHVENFDSRLPRGLNMNPRRGASLDALSWSTVAVAAVSFLCIVVKWHMTRKPKGWMEQQTLGNLPQQDSADPAPMGPNDRNDLFSIWIETDETPDLGGRDEISKNMQLLLDLPLCDSSGMERSVKLLRQDGPDRSVYQIRLYELEHTEPEKGPTKVGISHCHNFANIPTYASTVKRTDFDLSTGIFLPTYTTESKPLSSYDFIVEQDKRFAILEFTGKEDALKFQQAVTGFEAWASFCEYSVSLSFVIQGSKEAHIEATSVQIRIPKYVVSSPRATKNRLRKPGTLQSQKPRLVLFFNATKQMPESFVFIEIDDLFRNPVLVIGYPIPHRTRPDTGLELSLGVMAELVQSHYCVRMGDKVMIKGFNSLLIATALAANTIIWHFLFNASGDRISYCDTRLEEPEHIRTLDLRDIKTHRHIVGWCSKVTELLGCAQANYAIASSGLQYAPKSIVIDKLYIEEGSQVIDRKATLALWLGYLQPIVLYDVSERRAWLADGASVLLHLVRATIDRDKNEPAYRSKWRFDGVLKNDCGPHAGTTAVEVLSDFDNLNSKLYLDDKRPNENGEMVEIFYYFRDRVQEILYDLQVLVDYQAQAAAEDGYKIPQTGKILQKSLAGFDFWDVAQPTGPIRSRAHFLGSLGHGWVHYVRSIKATTLFGNGFGDLLQADGPDFSCGNLRTVPAGMNYLGSSVTTLKTLHRVINTTNLSPGEITSDILWRSRCELFSKCNCVTRSSDSTSSTSHLDVVQLLLPRKFQILLDVPKTSISIRLNELGDGGAVLFGHTPYKIGPQQRDDSLIAQERMDAGASSTNILL